MKVVILDMKTFGPGVTSDRAKTLGEVVVHDQTITPEELIEKIKDAEIVLTNKGKLTKEVIVTAKNLKYIGSVATGYDNIDVIAAKEMGIVVTNVIQYGTASVVEQTFALYFHLSKKLAFFDPYTKNKDWCKSSIFCSFDRVISELHGKQWGIIGLGEIGKNVATVAQSFGAKIVYHSTSGCNTEQPYKHLPLEELLKTSDIVSLHCPLNKNTQNLLDYEKLSLLSSNAILLNVARGGIINEEDLARILEEDKLGGAGLDVLAQEPPSEDNPLFSVKNKEKLIITPHIAWATLEARQRLFDKGVENVEAFLAGNIINQVNK